MNKQKFSIDMSTQLLDNIQVKDHRFWKVKIWLMHLGTNLNGTVFTRESVVNAIPSLANTPIMASIGEGYDMEQDFEGHEVDVFLSDNGDIKIVNATTPFGVIPETNNAKIETRLCDDMIEREFLTVEGLLWTKWDSAIDILLQKNGVTSQSMEITDVVYGEGVNDCVIEEFKFNGACLLGEYISPAMINSTAELQFSNNAAKYIKQKLDEYSQVISGKGGHILEETKFTEEEGTVVIEEPVSSSSATETTTSTTPTASTPTANQVTDSPQVTSEGVAATTTSDNQTDSTDSGAEERDTKTGKKKVTPAKKTISKSKEDEEESNVIQEVKDTVKIDPLTIDEIAKGRAQDKEEADKMPQPKDLIIARGVEFTAKDIEGLLDELTAIGEAYTQLQNQVHTEKVDELFAKYSSALETTEIESLREKAKTISIEELQTLIFASLGKKSYESNQEKVASFSIEGTGVKLDTSKVGISSSDSIDDIMKSFE